MQEIEDEFAKALVAPIVDFNDELVPILSESE